MFLSEKNSIDSFIAHMPGYLLIKDLTSTFVTGNIAAANEFGKKHPQQLFGFNDFTIPHPLAESGQFFVDLDMQLKQNEKPITGIYALPFQGQKIPFRFNKYFIKDEAEKNILIYSHAMPCHDALLLKAINILAETDQSYYAFNAPSCYFINNQYGGVDLNEKEAQCLFYLLRKKSVAEIGLILNESIKIIKSHIERINNQLQCDNNTHLTDKSINLKYLGIIPPGVTNQLCGTKLAGNSTTIESVKWSNRQKDCAYLLLRGYTIKEIAQELCLSPRTIETHLNNLKQKLQCRTNIDLKKQLRNLGNRLTW